MWAYKIKFYKIRVEGNNISKICLYIFLDMYVLFNIVSSQCDHFIYRSNIFTRAKNVGNFVFYHWENVKSIVVINNLISYI